MKVFNLSLFLGAILMLSFSENAIAQQAGRDFEVEEANRALVIEFYDKFFNHHQVDEVASIVAENYIQHNPFVPDGREPFVSYFKGFFKENPQYRARIVRSAVDGDIVWLHVYVIEKTGTQGKAVVDIFRVKDSKIVEHWDVIQPVPETAANNNTMF